ncbi:MAG TPA: VOC family protein [Smithellaceae bacterium]|nr:VOC family protein [Smithellaceae bacterium]
MISRIDHVSIAVLERQKAEHFFRNVLGAADATSGEDPSLKYFWRLFSLGDLSRLEIISPAAPGSFLDGFLSTRKAGVHHITLQTPDLEKAMDHLKKEGVPYFGYQDYGHGIWKEIFIHPRHAFGVLIQIAEFRPDDWLSDASKLPSTVKWQIQKTQTGATLRFAHPGGGALPIDLDADEIRRLSEQLQQLLV